MRAVIFANGAFNSTFELLPDDLLIAADGGASHCLRLGLTPRLLIGDFDSIETQELETLHAAGVEIVQHPQRKDFTDLELAMLAAQERGANEILVLAALGGRWDQTLANLLLPANARMAKIPVRLLDGAQEIHLLHGDPRGAEVVLNGQSGDLVSLIPLAGEAAGITTQGLEYPLADENLSFGSTRGVSNTLVAEQARVSLKKGIMLVVHIHGTVSEVSYEP